MAQLDSITESSETTIALLQSARTRQSRMRMTRSLLLRSACCYRLHRLPYFQSPFAGQLRSEAAETLLHLPDVLLLLHIHLCDGA
jgi:hypothetical protein